MGAFPVFSTIYPNIKEKLDQRGGNNLPMSKDGGGGVSGLTPWIRIVSSVGASAGSSNGGLVLQSIHNGDGFNARYGNYEFTNSKGKTIEERSGILGYQLDMKTPVRVGGRPLRPSPIVNSIAIDESDIGRRSTTFSIVAYTLEHMEKLAEYFLEPGFYVLMEWGWNTTAARSQWAGKSNGGVITPCEIASYQNWRIIAEKRKQSNFDYDATLGVITGGGIEFGDNETYILKIELTSLGEVAEYMQTHKDATSSTNTRQKSAKIFSPRTIQQFVEDKNNNPAGKALFAQMVNLLPAPKQTNELKKWVDSTLDNYMFTDQSSYVNMDIVILDNLLSNWGKSSSLKADGGENLKIPSDEPIISEDKFIRFELAIKILNQYAADLSESRKSNNKGGCDKYQTPLEISIENTICSGFPHMFSTDKSKLYIPNIKAPYFGIKDAFSGEPAKDKFIFNEEGKIEITQNLHPKTVFGSYSGTREKNGVYGEVKVPHAFPSNYELSKSDNSWDGLDSTMIPQTAPRGWWGWLKNLYINFDFFIEVLQTPNYTQRDVLYDLLNGMSGAVNSLWRFQIQERNNPKTGNTELQVVDMNFTGDISKIPDTGIKTFQSRGTKSPFIDASFSVSVPASTMNSTIQKRYSNDQNYEPNPDVNPQPIIGQVFSNKIDGVGTIVSGITFKDVTEDTDGKPIEKEPAPSENDIRLANYEFFLGKAGVFPKIQYRTDPYDVIKEGLDWNSGNDSSLENVFIVGTWNDTMALQQVLNYDKGTDIELNKGGSGGKLALNAPYGMARFEFKVHGLSGFKRGDVLRIDGIPKNFSNPHFFQVDGLEHEINSSGWFTSVKTGLRPKGENDNINE